MNAINPQTRWRPLVALLSGCLLFAAACSRSHTVTTSDGKVTYQEKGKDAGAVTVTGKDGKTATLSFNQNKLPDDYPKDVPVYSGSQVIMSQSATEKNARNLMLISSDSADQIAGYYKKELERNGWKTETTVATGQMNIMTANKGGKQVMIQISDGGDKRSIMQVLSDKD
jgi:hypothetical protein